MRNFVLATLATASAAVDISLAEYLNYLQVFRKAYHTIDEFQGRFDLFKASDAIIQEHNATESSYTLGHNLFSDMTPDEKWNRTHGRFQSRATQERKVVDIHEPSTDYPSSVDWRDHNAVTPVKDQGNCGSCWTFSSTGAMEGMYAVQSGKLLSFSEQQLVDCVYRSNGCNGGLQTDAFAYYLKNGVILEEDYAYTGRGKRDRENCKDKTTKNTGIDTSGKGWVEVRRGNVDAMKSALAKFPIAVSIDAASDRFSLYQSGIFDFERCGYSLDHAVLLVGYGEENGKEFWIMKNSWTADWGEDGYMRVAITGNGLGMCGIQEDCQYPVLA